MALSGVHICFGYGAGGVVSSSEVPLPIDAQSSQNMTSPGTSTISAPAIRGIGNLPLLSICASAAIYYAIGANPDASGSGAYPRRYFDPTSGGGSREDIFVQAGDKFAWVAA